MRERRNIDDWLLMEYLTQIMFYFYGKQEKSNVTRLFEITKCKVLAHTESNSEHIFWRLKEKRSEIFIWVSPVMMISEKSI